MWSVSKDKEIQRRKKKVVVRTFPNYSSNPKSQYYPQFCKYQLIKYKPWKDTIDELWEGNDPSDETYCVKWKEFLNSPSGQELVPNWQRHLINANNLEFQYADEDDDNDDENEDENLLREEWMNVADLSIRPENISSNENEQYWGEVRSSYSDEKINEMPVWIEEMKRTYEIERPNYSTFDIDRLNTEQRKAYDIVNDHYNNQSQDKAQLLMIRTGIAGSGKSYTITCIKRLLGDKCFLSAFFGIAAFNINGKTLSWALQLPIRNKRNHELKGNALQKLQNDMEGVEYIVIDEFSTVGQRMLGWIDSRCRQATGKKELLFGGISIILVGDIAQLPPVMDNVLYHSYPKNEMAIAGYVAYCCFRTIVRLKTNMRSNGEDDIQKRFRKALLNLRNGNSTEEDWKLFLSRKPEQYNLNCMDLTKLVFSNQSAGEHNMNLLDSLGVPIAEIKSQNSSKAASKLSSEEFGGQF